jgi:hypothetical protein
MTWVARYHAPPGTELDERPRLFRKRRSKPAPPLVSLGVDRYWIVSAACSVPLDTFEAPLRGRAVVLTRREADLVALANPGVRPPMALEDAYPWLPDQLFLDNARQSHIAATALLRRYSEHLVEPGSYCDERWNTICNTLRRRNGLDSRFHHAWQLPIQEAFVLEEDRPDRTVVAIDFNGMYGACMQERFPKPSTLRHIELLRLHQPGEPLESGLYRCVLENPATDFIRRHNPFRTLFAGRRLQTSLDGPVEVDLNEFEIAWFAKHFGQIELIDAVVSVETITHPLAREARRSFARRLNYRAQGNKPLADREKFLATLLSSCANRPRRRRTGFPNRGAAMEHLRHVYGINPPDDEPDVSVDAWLLRHGRIAANAEDGSTAVTTPALDDGSACFMLGQRIVAKGRVTLLETMERILSLSPTVGLCYANIDSIHFSVASCEAADVLAILRSWSGDGMGSFKIEAVARSGLWLEPGRYWLYSDGIMKFRNRSVGDRRCPFRDHAIHVTSRRIGDLHVPVRMTLRMEKTMSDTRALALCGDGTVQQRMIEVYSGVSYASVLDELGMNRSAHVPTRMAAFRRLAERMGDDAPPP